MLNPSQPFSFLQEWYNRGTQFNRLRSGHDVIGHDDMADFGILLAQAISVPSYQVIQSLSEDLENLLKIPLN